jgi:acetyl esterase/lipase
MGPAAAGPIAVLGTVASSSGPWPGRLWDDPAVRRTLGSVVVVAAAVLLATLALDGCGEVDDTSVGSGTPLAADGTPTGCADAPGSPTTVTYEEVHGVDPNLLSVDVYQRPAGCAPAPVLFWVHGGAWVSGDKSTEGTATKATWAAEHGWVLVAVNYRLSTPGSGVVWPTHGEDVAAAIGFTLDHATQFGIDADRVGVMGHSAGGHLVSIVSVDPELLAAVGHDRSEIGCLVPLDTEGYDLVDRVDTEDVLIEQLIADAFGTDATTRADASPLQTLERAGGPVPDALIITRGPRRRQAEAQAFADAVRHAGGEVVVVDAEGYSHGDVNQRLATAGESVVTPPVTAFFEACLA